MKVADFIEELLGYEDYELEITVINGGKGIEYDDYTVVGVEEARDDEKVLSLGIEYKGGIL